MKTFENDIFVNEIDVDKIDADEINTDKIWIRDDITVTCVMYDIFLL